MKKQPPAKQPSTKRYCKAHTWLDEMGHVGLSKYALDKLGNISYVELPRTDDLLVAGHAISSIESIKAADDIIAPVDGVVTAINKILDDSPEKINPDMAILKIKFEYNDYIELMSEEEYNKYIQSLP